MTGYVIRRAVVGDAAIVAHHRVAVFLDMGQVPTDALAAALLEASTAALIAFVSDGLYVGWLAKKGTAR